MEKRADHTVRSLDWRGRWPCTSRAVARKQTKRAVRGLARALERGRRTFPRFRRLGIDSRYQGQGNTTEGLREPLGTYLSASNYAESRRIAFRATWPRSHWRDGPDSDSKDVLRASLQSPTSGRTTSAGRLRPRTGRHRLGKYDRLIVRYANQVDVSEQVGQRELVQLREETVESTAQDCSQARSGGYIFNFRV